MPTQSQILAIGRNVATYAACVATSLGVLHLLSANDAANAVTAVNEISDGFGKLFAIGAPIVGLVSAWFASRSASPTSQIQAVNAGDNGVKVVADNVANRSVPVISQPVTPPPKLSSL